MGKLDNIPQTGSGSEMFISYKLKDTTTKYVI